MILKDLTLKILLIVFLLPHLGGCDALSENESEYTIIPTGVEVHGGTLAFNWCDNDHIAFITNDAQRKRNLIASLDLRNMQHAPVEIKDGEGRALNPWPAWCPNNQMLAGPSDEETREAQARGDKTFYLYGGPIGGHGKRLVLPTERVLGINFKAKYILAEMPKIKTDDGYKVEEQCATYHHPDYRLLCFYTETGVEKFIALDQFIIAPYRWDDIVYVRKQDGTMQGVRNLRPPLLLDKDIPVIRYEPIPEKPGTNRIVREPQPPGSPGLPVRAAMLLYDLNLNLLAKLTQDPVYKVFQLGFVVAPDESYVYSPCIEKAISKFDLDFNGVCRYKLDGKQNQWEQVFSSEIPIKEKTTVQDISVSRNGDVFFILGGKNRTHIGVWKFENSAKKIIQITHVRDILYDEAPKVSPDGTRVAFSRPDKGRKLFIAQLKGATK